MSKRGIETHSGHVVIKEDDEELHLNPKRLSKLLREIRDALTWQKGEDPAYKDANIHHMLYAVKYAIDHWGSQTCKRLDRIIQLLEEK